MGIVKINKLISGSFGIVQKPKWVDADFGDNPNGEWVALTDGHVYTGDYYYLEFLPSARAPEPGVTPTPGWNIWQKKFGCKSCSYNTNPYETYIDLFCDGLTHEFYRTYVPGHWETADGKWTNGHWGDWNRLCGTQTEVPNEMDQSNLTTAVFNGTCWVREWVNEIPQ